MVSNHNPELDVRGELKIADPRVVLVTQPVARGCGHRWHVIQDFPFDYLISVDDDVLLSAAQLTRLFESLVANPDVPHGISGLFKGPDGEQRYAQRTNASVEYLTEVFAVTRGHLKNYLALQEALAADSDRARSDIESSVDFVILSRSGSGKAAVHDFGHVLRCESFKDPTVAVSLQEDFWTKVERVSRAEVRRELLGGPQWKDRYLDSP